MEFNLNNGRKLEIQQQQQEKVRLVPYQDLHKLIVSFEGFSLFGIHVVFDSKLF